MSILLVVIAALSMSALAPVKQAFSQQAMIRAEQRKLDVLQSENQNLEERLQRLQDPEYVEKLAREELGLVKPGEIAYVVVPGEIVTETVKAPVVRDKPWYRKTADWLKALFG